MRDSLDRWLTTDPPNQPAPIETEAEPFESPPMTDDAAAVLEKVREVIRNFNWEFDDRQIALEKIERIVFTEVY